MESRIYIFGDNGKPVYISKDVGNLSYTSRKGAGDRPHQREAT